MISFASWWVTDKSPFQRCLDSPYLKCNAPPLPDLPADIVLPKPFTQEAMQAPHLPKKDLNEWYVSFAKHLRDAGYEFEETPNECAPSKDNYNSWSNGKESPNTLFTSIFTCSLSGERFASGKCGPTSRYKEKCMYYHIGGDELIPLDKEDSESDDSMSDSDEIIDMSGLQKVNLIWYKTKKEAENAAASRAIDCLRYRDSILFADASLSGNQYCKEVPYLSKDITEPWKSLSKSVKRVGNTVWALGPDDDESAEGCWTTKFNVPDLHCLIGRVMDDEQEMECWRIRRKEARCNDASISTSSDDNLH